MRLVNGVSPPAQKVGALVTPDGVTLRYVTAEEYKRRHLEHMCPGEKNWGIFEVHGLAGNSQCPSQADAQYLLSRRPPGQTCLVCPPRDHALYPRVVYRGCCNCSLGLVPGAVECEPCASCRAWEDHGAPHWQPEQEKPK